MKSTKSLSTFKLVFTAVLSLTLASGGTAIHLAGQPTLTEPQERLLNSAIAAWTMGTTTLIGLLNSDRPTNQDKTNEDDN